MKKTNNIIDKIFPEITSKFTSDVINETNSAFQSDENYIDLTLTRGPISTLGVIDFEFYFIPEESKEKYKCFLSFWISHAPVHKSITINSAVKVEYNNPKETRGLYLTTNKLNKFVTDYTAKLSGQFTATRCLDIKTDRNINISKETCLLVLKQVIAGSLLDVYNLKENNAYGSFNVNK
jgi:hypothetical protein